MKGIVFNLLEDAVSSAYGDATWDRLLDAAGLDGAYTSLGSYDDDEIFALVRVAADTLGIPPDDVLRIGYNSPRRLRALAEGFMRGAAGHFGERLEVEQPECMHRGAARCVFHVRVLPQ